LKLIPKVSKIHFSDKLLILQGILCGTNWTSGSSKFNKTSVLYCSFIFN
jgi:hypothetical protein